LKNNLKIFIFETDETEEHTIRYYPPGIIL